MTETKFCSNCGAEIDKKAEICPKCGVRVMKAPLRKSLPNKPKNQDNSAILSLLIPGLGQIYNEEVGKGILIILGILSTIFILPQLLFFANYLFYIAPYYVLVPSIPFLQIVIYIIIWLFAIYDAYNTAKNINMSIGV